MNYALIIIAVLLCLAIIIIIQDRCVRRRLDDKASILELLLGSAVIAFILVRFAGSLIVDKVSGN